MKTFKRILLGLLAVLAILILLIPLSIFGDALVGGSRIETLTNTTIPGVNGAPDVRAYVAVPEGEGPFPTVIMIHEFFGLNESITSKADLLAQEGYLVIAPDTFRGQTTSLIPRAIYLVSTTEQTEVNADLDSVYAWLKAQPNVDASRIGIAGFCYGGRISLLYSLHNGGMAATVIFYGSSETDPEVLKNLSGPVLGIFGGADQSIPLEEVDALESGLGAAGIPHQISIYDGQPHAFMLDAEAVQADPVQAAAWEEMLVFLDANLKAKSHQPGTGMVYEAQFPWQYYAMLVYEHAFGSASHHH
ncbi:MAG: dienelactone hydrolase family protein [Anaerolineae bacterium]|nr:dienelactone hydrolase family protein [Anaerolineae bacterium]